MYRYMFHYFSTYKCQGGVVVVGCERPVTLLEKEVIRVICHFDSCVALLKL